MFECGTLIGIANGEVYFVYHIGSANGLPLVARVISYRPVVKSDFELLRNKFYAIDEDPFDTFHLWWREAVAANKTEEGYREFAEGLWNYEDMSYDQPLWFYGQDCSGWGEILIEDMDLHNKVKADLEPLIYDEIGSWEFSSLGDPCADLSNPEEPIEWDVIYNRDAVDGCLRYCDAKRRGIEIIS